MSHGLSRWRARAFARASTFPFATARSTCTARIRWWKLWLQEFWTPPSTLVLEALQPGAVLPGRAQWNAEPLCCWCVSAITSKPLGAIGRPGTQLLAEDSQVLAFAGPPEAPEWLDAEAAAALLIAEPDANLAPELQRQSVERMVAGLPDLLPQIEAVARKRGDELLEAHTRVRTAMRLRGISQRVEAQLPPDILGLYVFLPVPSAGAGA